MLEGSSGLLGLPFSTLRFLLCLFVSVPLAWPTRTFKPSAARHAYNFVTGALLSVVAYGFKAQQHFYFPIAFTYVAMLANREFCGVITFVGTFGYLIACHATYMSANTWRSGAIDFTGSLMVLTLKLISAAMNYQDGAAEDARIKMLKDGGGMTGPSNTTPATSPSPPNPRVLLRQPEPLEFLGYVFAGGNFLVGPVTEISEYMEWSEDAGVYAVPEGTTPPDREGPLLLALLKVVLFAALNLYVTAQFPKENFLEPIYRQWGFWRRLYFIMMVCVTIRTKYYFVWTVAEAQMVALGLGFSGWSKDSPPRALWERGVNVMPLRVELAQSYMDYPRYWNIRVGMWLRHYVYDRITFGRKPGFPQLLAAQVVSGVWHGLFPGQLLYFVHSAFYIACSRVIYRWQKALGSHSPLVRVLLGAAHMTFASVCNAYASMGFVLVTAEDSLKAWSGVYFLGSWLPLVVLGLAQVVRLPRHPPSGPDVSQKEL